MRNLYFLFLIFISCKTSIKEERKAVLTQLKMEAKILDSATLSYGKLIRVDSFPSKYITPRPVDVWLPENYSSEKKYAVLYMHDGQMLFDANTTWNKQEWMIDEVASKLMNEGTTKDFIVIGIHNIPAIRWQDLFPEKAIHTLSKEEITALLKLSKNQVDLNGNEYLSFWLKK